jgi:hypothetical protein
MRPDLMPRPFRTLRTACRVFRQAVAIWSWMKAACASAAGILSRSLKSISQVAMELIVPTAAPAARPTRKRNADVRRPNAGPLWRRLKRLASISGSRRSKPADRTSPTAPKSSSGSSNTSAAPGDSPRCSSSSTTIRRPGAPQGTACSKRSAASSPRTSTRAALSDRSRSGRRTNWSRSCRSGSPRPCR